MKCPECGAAMILRQTRKFTTVTGEPRLFWGCERWPYCRGTHGAHPDGTPLGIPGNKETKLWRIKAHRALEKAFPRSSTRKRYKKLQLIMMLGEEDAHIGKFTIEQCKHLIEVCERRSFS